mmetsp:Transcript_19132/g.18267  ORF Transcript_19132/g.18267 Transcript_19132/m.18267 type:complete len:86 (-) Transcript_19132:25-282(-)
MFKIKSLSHNKNVLNLDMQNDDMGGNNQDKYVYFGNTKIPKEYLKFEMETPCMLEEFNKKVFKLIDLSMDENKLCLMKNNWNPWF